MSSPTLGKDLPPSETEQQWDGHLPGCGQGQITRKGKEGGDPPALLHQGEHSTYPAVGIRGVPGEIHHVVQSKESWWGTAEILGWVAVVLGGHKGRNLAAAALFSKQQCFFPAQPQGLPLIPSTALAVQEPRGNRREVLHGGPSAPTGTPGSGKPSEGATKALCWSQRGAGEGMQGELTMKPSLRNSLAHRDRRRSVLKVPADTSLSDSKALWRRDWRRSRCSWRDSRDKGVLVSPTEAGSPRTNPDVNYFHRWKGSGPDLQGESSQTCE